MMDNHWIYNGVIFEEKDIADNFGYVYKITNLLEDKSYIGKKFFFSSRRKSVKGKKRKIRVKNFSDWQDYYGSSQDLIDDVEKLGKNNFKREIIRLCKSKSECTYFEAKLQFEHNVLLSDKWYNKWIMCRVRASNLKDL